MKLNLILNIQYLMRFTLHFPLVKIHLLLSVFLLILLSLASSCSSPEHKFVIGVSQCSDDEWRNRMNREIMREALFYPEAEVIIKTAKDSNEKQISDIEDFIAKKVDLIVVAPNEAKAITPVVEKAYNMGIPVVMVDRKILSDKYSAFVGADNYDIGRQIGIYIVNRLKGSGKVVELTGSKGSTPAFERQKGMMEIIDSCKMVQIIASADAGWLRDHATSAFDTILNHYKDIDLVFAQNDPMAAGAYEAAKKYGREKEMLFVGVDALSGENLGVELVSKRILDATFIYPTGGDKVMQVAMAILKGEDYSRENLMSTALVNASNARIMQMQNIHINTLDEKIGVLNEKLDTYFLRYSAQRMFLYACIVILILASVLLFFVVRAYWTKIRLNTELSNQKSQLEKQRDLLEQQKNQLQEQRDKLEEQRDQLEEQRDKLKEQKTKLEDQRDQLIELSKRLEDATHAKLSFFTNVSHDFRTPLTLIADPVDRLLESTTISSNDRFLLNIIHKNVTVLLRLINQIMDFRKFENGKLEMHLSKFDISKGLSEWTEAFRTLAYRKHIQFKLTVDANGDNTADAYMIIADAEMMERVTYNLLSNAFKFTPENGKVSVCLSKVKNEADEDCICIKFSDTGVGMPADHVKHIFESFYQIDVHHAGSGIGLALVKAFVEMHRGNISVESSQGNGTLFSIIIPVFQDGEVSGSVERKALLNNLKEGAVLMAAQENISVSEIHKLHCETDDDAYDHKSSDGNGAKRNVLTTSSSHGILSEVGEKSETDNLMQDYSDDECISHESTQLVLVIDDNQDVRDYVKILLEEKYSVIEASNGAEGLKLAIKYVPDIIICDVMMPVMDGMECCKKLKSEQRTSHIPVMMLTAYSVDEQKIKGYECGADSYISKPFSAKLLLVRLQNLLDNHKRLQNFFADKSVINAEPLPETDKGFVDSLRELIDKNLSNPDFSVEEMGEKIGFSRVQLYRKTKSLTGYTPNELLRIARLNKANALISTSDKNVSEIAYEVGFSSPSYFTKCFKEYFGESPTDCQKRKL